MTKIALNPVQEAALEMAKRYGHFTHSPAQLLVWDTDKDTQKMVQSMVTTHIEVVALVNDLILPVNTPFTNPKTYEFEVAKNIVEDLLESQADKNYFNSDLDNWNPSLYLEEKHPLGSLLGDFAERIKETAKHVTLYFHPSLISDYAAFEIWISELLAETGSPLVQYMFFDIYEQGIASRLKAKHGRQVEVFNDRVNLNQIMRKTLEQETKDEPPSPEKAFGAHLVNGITYLRENDQKKGHEEIFRAYDIATTNKWSEMRITALLTYGNSLKAQDHYQEIEKIAQQIFEISENIDEGESQVAVVNLLMQSYFMSGTNNLINKKWRKAYDAYSKATKNSVLVGNRILEFEARRMSVTCAIKISLFDEAWETGILALDIATDFPDEIRTGGTLPNLAKDLSQVASRKDAWHKEFTTKMYSLFGGKWRQYV